MDITENSDQQNEQEQLSPYDAFCQELKNIWKNYIAKKIDVEQRVSETSKLLDKTEIEDPELYNELNAEDEKGEKEINKITGKILHEIKYNK